VASAGELEVAGARWDALSVDTRIRILRSDSSMKAPQWAGLVARMAASTWGQLSPVQRDAAAHLLAVTTALPTESEILGYYKRAARRGRR
jgi:hypothetical protein